MTRIKPALDFAPAIYFFFVCYFLFHQLLSELTERNSTELCHMLGSEPYLFENACPKFGVSLPVKIGAPKTTGTYIRRFRLCNVMPTFLWHEARYRQWGDGAGNYKGSPTTSLNCMSFGLQTPKNTSVVYFHTQYNSTSLRASVHAASGIKVAPHSECEWNGIGLLCSPCQFGGWYVNQNICTEKPVGWVSSIPTGCRPCDVVGVAKPQKDFDSALALLWADLSGSTWLIVINY